MMGDYDSSPIIHTHSHFSRHTPFHIPTLMFSLSVSLSPKGVPSTKAWTPTHVFPLSRTHTDHKNPSQ